MFGFGSKKLTPDSDTDIDFSELDDFNFDDMDMEDNSRNVSLTSKFKRAVGDELAYKRSDAKLRRELLKKALPSEYTPVLENYDTVSNEVGKFWREQQKEWDGVRKHVKSAIQPFGDVASKLGFKKLKDWAESSERSSGSADVDQAHLDELRISEILNETFGEYGKSQAQAQAVRQDIEDERYAEDRADKDMANKTMAKGNEILEGINRGISAQRGFNEQVTYNYQRKNIELQARQLVTQQRQLQMLTSYREESMKELQAIHKNTGLPDFLKINTAEIAQQQLTQKIMGGIMAPFSGVGGKLTGRVMGKIRDKMKGFWEFTGSSLSALNDNNRDTVDSGGSVLGSYGNLFSGMLIGSALDKGIGKVSDFLSPKIREQLQKRGLDVHGDNLSSLFAQLPTLANKGLKNGFNNNLLDGIADFFDLRSAAITGDRTAFDSRNLDLEKAAFMDNRLRLTIVDIIPAWLKKISANTYYSAFKKKAPDETWDFKRGDFISSDALDHENMDRIVKKDNVIRSVEAVNAWLDMLDPSHVLSNKTREWMKKWILKERAGSDAMHPLELLSPTTNAPEDVKAELLFTIPVLMGLSEKDREKIMNADGVTDLAMFSMRGNRTYNDKMRKLSDASIQIRSTSVLDEKEIEEMAKSAEGRRFLIKAGIIVPGQDGTTFLINPDFEEKAFGTYRQNYRQNGRIMDEDGQWTVNTLDEDYDPRDEKMRLGNKLRYGSMQNNVGKQKRRLEEIAARRSGGLAFDDLMVGDDYLVLPDGTVISSEDSNFDTLKKALSGNKKYNFGTNTGFDYLRPLQARKLNNQRRAPFNFGQRRRFAAGGQIPSFAKGGETFAGQPDEEQLVKTHGGEFVVSKDATDFNKSLLGAINKIGAPLINSDNTINSAYYKLFGFKSEKEFRNGAKLKGLTSKAKEFANEQKETAIKKIWENLDIRSGISREEMNSILDVKLSADRRLTNAMKLWTKQQQNAAKSDPKAYAKGLGRMGITNLHKRFNQFIDPNNEGTNIEILNQLGAIGGKVGSDLKDTLKGLGGAAYGKSKAAAINQRGAMLDRDRTMMAVTQSLSEVENPKMFTVPIDLYLEGRGTPFVTKAGFKNGEYIDQKTGAVIKNPSEITGTIVDKEGSVLITTADLVTNKVVTRARKKYRLMGMDDANRRFMSSTEYAGKRYSIIAQSEKFQDLLEKGRNARDKYVLDKPVDIYSRAKKLLLTAQGFKDRRYMDQETGNMLWSHHDITGPVADLQDNKNIVLTQEDLNDGLFDKDGNHLKISKIKQYRNMAFKRGAETYNKYAAKHVNKARDKALNWMSAMGEKRVGLNYDNDPIDIYVVGEKEPRITAAQFKAGKVFCKDKPIKSHSGISGAVMMQNEHGWYVKISTEELAQLSDASGNKLQLPLMMSATSRFGAYLKEAALPSSKLKSLTSFLRLSGDKRQEKMNEELLKMKVAYDVYVKGSPEKPVLTKIGFESNQYISKTTGKPVVVPEQIDGVILSINGQEVLTEEHLKKGLETFDGKPVRIDNGGLLNKVLRGFSLASRVGKVKYDSLRTSDTGVPDPDANRVYTLKVKKGKNETLEANVARANNMIFTDADIKAGRLVRLISDDEKGTKTEPVKKVTDIDAETYLTDRNFELKNGVSFLVFFLANGYIVDDKGNVVETKYHKQMTSSKKGGGLRSKLGGKISSLFGALKEKFGFGLRDGSWQQQREDGKDKKKDKDGKPVEKEKKDSWMGKLIKKLMIPFSALFGGVGTLLGGIKTVIGTSISWLGKSLMAKMAGSAIGGALGNMGGAGGGMLSRMGWRGKLAAAAAVGGAGYMGYKYLDGNADNFDPANVAGFTNSTDAANDPTAAMTAGQNPEAPNDPSNPIWNTMKEWGPEAALAAATLFPIRTAKMIGKVGMGVGRGFGKGFNWAAKQGLKGTASLAGKAASKLPMMGRLAAGAGRLAGMAGMGTWSATGAVASGALNIGKMLFAGARLLTPVGIGLTVAYFGGKALLKLWNNHKNPWNRFRLAQYGFNHNDKTTMEKIGQIESIATNLVSISGKSVTLKNDEKAVNEILKVCGFKDENGQDLPDEQARLPNFAVWFKERFLRVFASYLQGLQKVTGKAEMIDLQTLSREQQEKLLKSVHFTSVQGSPYALMQSPFKEPSSCETDFNDVDKISRKLRDKISQLPKTPEKQGAKTQDGLDGKIDENKAGKDAATKASDKAMNADQITEKTKAEMGDSKNMTDEATKAVRYNAAASKAIADEHNKAMIETTEAAATKTDGIFDRVWKSFSERIKNFASAASTAASKFANGDIMDAAGDVAGMVPGANGLFSGAQWLKDQVTSIGGGDAKAAQKGLVEAALQAGITSPTEIAMLLAQAAHESGGFKTTRELGNDAYFAKYNNRKDLGNGPNDGAKYKGRGYIQLTGKANYAAFSKWAGKDFVKNPELVEKEPWASAATIWFWTQHPNMTRRGRAAAQKGDVVGATKAVNGGTRGLDDRQKYWTKYSQEIGNDVNGFLAKLGGGKEGAVAAGTKAVNKPGPTGGLNAAGVPNLLAKPTATQKAAGGVVGGAMASLDQKYGGGGTAAVTSKAAQTAASNVTNAGGAEWDLDKIAAAAAANAKSGSIKKCATYVRMAMQAGDLKKQFIPGLASAYMYMEALPKMGWVPVGNNKTVKPQKGDICVFPRYGSNKGGGASHGHICVFTGSQWISDFVQVSMFPNASNQTLAHTIFRAKHGITKAGPVSSKATFNGVGVDEVDNVKVGTVGRAAIPAPVKGDQTYQKPQPTVNKQLKDINSGASSTTTVNSQQYVQPQPSEVSMKETNNILTKQLSVQEKMLVALEKIASMAATSAKQAEVQQGVSTPDMSKINKQIQRSPIGSIPDPISVKKPA